MSQILFFKIPTNEHNIYENDKGVKGRVDIDTTEFSLQSTINKLRKSKDENEDLTNNSMRAKNIKKFGNNNENSFENNKKFKESHNNTETIQKIICFQNKKSGKIHENHLEDQEKHKIIENYKGNFLQVPDSLTKNSKKHISFHEKNNENREWSPEKQIVFQSPQKQFLAVPETLDKNNKKYGSFHEKCSETNEKYKIVQSTQENQTGTILEKVKLSNGPIALKKVPESSRTLIKCLMEEAKILSSLAHENIVTILGHEFENESNFIALEWMQTDLQKQIDLRKLNNNPFKKNEIFLLIENLLAGMTYLRLKRIFHGDIKPSNILFNGETYKIADFGNSRNFSELREDIFANFDVGTPGYWSPELRNAFFRNLSKTEYNVFKVDAFALGMTLLSAITLTSTGENFRVLEEKSKRKKMFKEIEKRYGQEIEDIIKKILKFDYKRRKTAGLACFQAHKNAKKLVKRAISQLTKLKMREIDEFIAFKPDSEIKSFVIQRKNMKKFLCLYFNCPKEDEIYYILQQFSKESSNSLAFQYYNISQSKNYGGFELRLYANVEGLVSLLDLINERSQKQHYLSFEELLDFAFRLVLLWDEFEKTEIDLQWMFMDNKREIFLIKKNVKQEKDEAKENSSIISKINGTNNKNGKIQNKKLKELDDEKAIFNLGLVLFGLATLSYKPRNEKMEEKMKELYFFSEETIECVLGKYGEELMYLLMAMIKFNPKKRISHAAVVNSLETMRKICKS